MINQLIALCFRRRHLAWVIAILVAVYGYISWTHMAVEAYPDISDVTVQVTTQVPGLAAEEIEQQITTPLERALSNTPGVVTVRSSSTFAVVDHAGFPGRHRRLLRAPTRQRAHRAGDAAGRRAGQPRADFQPVGRDFPLHAGIGQPESDAAVGTPEVAGGAGLEAGGRHRRCQ